MDQDRNLRLEYEAIVVAYAMSRLDGRYLLHRGIRTWSQAFLEASGRLGPPAASFKNLRDEFDPVHGNRRRGWHQRPLRPNRQRVMAELCELSDDALMDFVARILGGDSEEIAEVVESFTIASKVVYNVAERLRTGRLAEEHFLEKCGEIVGVDPREILDLRNAACGYDFGIKSRPEIAIETKGLRGAKGEILFTDREWGEARLRGQKYWLVVVGNLDTSPSYRVFPDPSQLLDVKCQQRSAVVATWRSHVSLIT